MPAAHIEIEGDDCSLDAFAACPDGPPRPPVLLLADRRGLRPAFEVLARRLSAHGYFVLAPDWTARLADERRDDAEAWLDHLADDRRVDDTRVGLLGYGAGADLALRIAAWRAERVAATAAFLGRGFAAVPALQIAQRVNGLVHLGYAAETLPAAGLATFEAALRLAGVDFESDVYPAEPEADPPLGEAHWLRILDLFDRTLGVDRSEPRNKAGSGPSIHR